MAQEILAVSGGDRLSSHLPPTPESPYAHLKPARQADASALAVLAQYQAQFSAIGSSLSQHVDIESGRVVIRVTSLSSGEVLRQIPSEDALRLAQILKSLLEGHVDELA